MTALSQAEKAQRLRAAIQSPQTLILPELWDVPTARMMVDSGFGIVGTSATAIAWVFGYRQHERPKLEDLLMVAARIARGNDTPVNADLEGGVGRSDADVKRAVQAAISIGCAGITIGDGSRNGAHGVMPADEMANRIKAARAAAIELGVPINIMARTEVFQLGPLGQSPFDTALSRADIYHEAGADCILVNGIQHVSVVERLTQSIDAPVAISIGLSSAPDVAEFANIGVAAICLGSTLLRSLLGNLRVKVEELKSFGHFTHLDRAIGQEELEEMLR